MVSFDHQLDTTKTPLGRVSMRAYICWFGLRAYLWDIVLIRLTDMRSPSWLWAVPFPRQELCKSKEIKLGTSKQASKQVNEQASMHACIYSFLCLLLWLDVSGLCCLTFPKIMDCNLELLVKTTPFSSELLVLGVYCHSDRMKLEYHHNGLPETRNTDES
jgi:hypothetical protein